MRILTRSTVLPDGGRPLPDLVRKTMTWSLVVATVLAASSCARGVDGHAVTATRGVATPIEWTHCDPQWSDPQSPIPPDALCGKLRVPVDYAKPDGDAAELALIRFPASGAKIGSLVINPGGPGESGVQVAVSTAQSLPRQLRERFDLIGFDPRGIANSTPAVRCNSDAYTDKLRADPQTDYSPEGVAHIEKLTKEFVARCIDKMSTQYLANIGTANVVKDLDVLRAALGEDKLTYLGYSYGTLIGANYAEAYPQHVRAMVLDGAVDPSVDPTEASVRQAEAFQKAFNDYAADCAKAPDCPLGTDPAKAVDVYHSLVDPLGPKLVPTGESRGLSYSDATTGTVMALYQPSLWKYLTKGLTELKAGRGDTLLRLADVYLGRDRQGHYNNSSDVQVAVTCVDRPPVTERAKAVDEDRRIRQVAPFMSYGQFTGQAPLSTCAFWPVPPTSQPHQISVKGLPPTLVVSTTHDPATPYGAGVNLAKQLGGSLLTFDGTQHTVALQGNACVDAIVTRYLIDPSVPARDARCNAHQLW